RAKQATDPFGITFGIINSADIDSTNFLQVIPYGTNRLLPIAVQVARPSSDGDELGDSRYGQFCIRASKRFSSKQCRQRNLVRRVAGFREGHRAHAEACQTSGARMAGDIVGRYRRSRQYKLTGYSSVVDRSANVVPYRRRNLPLVN